MSKSRTMLLVAVSAALCLPALASARAIPGQFPYTAWSCTAQWCSVSQVPAEGESPTWTKTPGAVPYTAPGLDWGQPPAAIPDVDADTLDRFAAALAEIKEISAKFRAAFPGADQVEQAQALREEAQGSALAALDAAQISVDQYNEIADAMDKDLRFRMRVFAAMD